MSSAQIVSATTHTPGSMPPSNIGGKAPPSMLPPMLYPHMSPLGPSYPSYPSTCATVVQVSACWHTCMTWWSGFDGCLLTACFVKVWRVKHGTRAYLGGEWRENQMCHLEFDTVCFCMSTASVWLAVWHPGSAAARYANTGLEIDVMSTSRMTSLASWILAVRLNVCAVRKPKIVGNPVS